MELEQSMRDERRVREGRSKMEKFVVETYTFGTSKWKCSLHDPRSYVTRLFVNAPTRDEAIADARKCAEVLGLDVDWSNVQ